MCTWNTSPLCRFTPELVMSTAGTVGDAPLRYKPVESTPSPALLYRSNFTATLLAMPGVPVVLSGPYPKPPPVYPMEEALLPCMVKVKPSAVLVAAGVIWKLKSVVKAAMLASTWYHAAAASLPPPSVSSSAEPFNFALPSRFMLPAVKPLPRLMAATPPKSMVYSPLATGLLLSVLAVAIADKVSVAPMATGPLYLALVLGEGFVPSVV